ncbi:MAG: hypothetical protein J6Y16_03470 [Treponema sp.]|nr:hypothetical protein [Treponema sp.]
MNKFLCRVFTPLTQIQVEKINNRYNPNQGLFCCFSFDIELFESQGLLDSLGKDFGASCPEKFCGTTCRAVENIQ